MRKFTILVAALFFIMIKSNSQNIWELGGEYQHAFGKGVNDNIIGARYEGFKSRSSWSFGLTYNLGSGKKSDKDDFKGGFGLYAGFRHGFSYNSNGDGNGFVGFRASFNFNTFDAHGSKSVTDATITPTFETGYQFIFGTHAFTTPSLAYGYSIKLNPESDAPKSEEGSKIIPGVAIGYRF